MMRSFEEARVYGETRLGAIRTAAEHDLRPVRFAAWQQLPRPVAGAASVLRPLFLSSDVRTFFFASLIAFTLPMMALRSSSADLAAATRTRKASASMSPPARPAGDGLIRTSTGTRADSRIRRWTWSASVR